jgi:DNA replication licensing factor MCM7
MRKVSKETIGHDFTEETNKLADFLLNYTNPSVEDHPIHGKKVYLAQMQAAVNRECNVITVYIEDLDSYFTKSGDSRLLKGMIENTKRYQHLMLDAIDKNLPPPTNDPVLTTQDVIIRQRLQSPEASNILPDLIRTYELYFAHRSDSKPTITPLRQIGANQIGHLIDMKGIVTRVTGIMAMLEVAAYVCEECGHELYQTVHTNSFAPLVECMSQRCKINRSKGRVHLQTRLSKFVPYQEVVIQEPTDEVPKGQVPRRMKAKLYGNNVRKCAPGETVTLSGIFLPMVYTGYRGLRAGLLHDNYLEIHSVTKLKKSYRDTNLSPEMESDIASDTNINIYTRLAKSIAPEIHGMEDVKKALLLQLVGGETKHAKDGMKIRGDINILLMGDPGVAKSQLLKHITRLVPRGIYTTGKGSSGVGLTAAVVKDSTTGDLMLEGGALVLSDMGICCIDEFDKMDERDRTAIHEVMEQQTVSIAKAGITTTLNARASILAAANPAYGRYDRKKTPHENINLPAALLSRFDIVFLLLDKADDEKDRNMASHITYVHQKLKPPELDFGPLDDKFMRAYIAEAKKIEPTIPNEVQQFIVNKYVEKRQEQNNQEKAGYVYVTPRTLLGIIRLAQSLARLRFSEIVSQDDIEEALRLMEVSMSTINNDKKAQRYDPVSSIFNLIKEDCKQTRDRTVEYSKLERRIIAKGYSIDQLNECINTYAGLNVLMRSNDRSKVTLIE